MRTSRRKKSNCQNCQYPLLDNYNYCPNCGQENSEKLISFSTLIGEFFNNLIAYDSRLARTIVPFLFKPGFLTNEFIGGKRVKYMHPLRLYFIISFFYFFALTLVYKQTNTSINIGQDEPAPTAPEQPMGDMPTGLNMTLDPDSVGREDEGEVRIFNRTFSMEFLKDKRTTEAQVVDSLGWQQTKINRYIIRQAIKFTRSDSKSIGAYFSGYMLDKASLLMFFMLPVFALLLKLVYLRRKRYYVEHLTFSLHIHAFAFFILLLMMIVEKLWVNDSILTGAMLIILLYGAVAAKRVYRQSWIKTLLKGFLLFVPYTVCFALLTTVAVIIAGLVY